MQKVALVTGANRGIGLAIVKQLLSEGVFVYASTRDISSYPLTEIPLLYAQNLRAEFLDVSDRQSIRELSRLILQRHGGIDILVNNAGVYLDDPRKTSYESITDIDLSVFDLSMKINVSGPLTLISEFLPTMKERNYGRIVNISSGMGRFDDMNMEGPFYRISKAALNALTKVVSSDVEGYDILVNSVCPGWVRTDMGGENAAIIPADAAIDIVWACLLPSDGPSGLFFRNRRILDWCKKQGYKDSCDDNNAIRY